MIELNYTEGQQQLVALVVVENYNYRQTNKTQQIDRNKASEM